MLDRGPEAAKEAYVKLGELDKLLSNMESWDTTESLEKLINSGISSPAAEVVLAIIAEVINTESFLVDDWAQADIRTCDEVLLVIRMAAERLASFIKKQRDQLSLLKILENKDDYGAMIMPTELLRALWKLGNDVVDITDKQDKSPKLEDDAKTVLELSAAWVRYVNRRWGKPQQFDIIPVRPVLATEKIPF